MNKATKTNQVTPTEVTAAPGAPRRVLLPPRTRAGPQIAIAALEAGVTQDRLEVPICPDAQLRDDRLFVDPASNAPRFWLPRYELSEEVAGGERRYRIVLKQQGEVWRLELVLQRIAAPQVQSKAEAANIIDHALEVVLGFDAGSGTRRSLPFEEVGPPGETVAAALILARLVDRDQVLAALRDPAHGCTLDVRRSFRVALAEGARGGGTENQPMKLRLPITAIRPLPDRVLFHDRLPPVAISPLILHKPQLAFLRSEPVELRGRPQVRHFFTITNWQKYGAHFFAPAPDLPPCGSNTNSSRSWVELQEGGTGRRLSHFCALGAPATLQKLSFVTSGAQPVPNALQVQIHDRKANQKVVSDPVALRAAPPPPPPKPTFRVVDAVLDHRAERQPFAFPPELYAYVYDIAGLGDGVTGPPDALVRHRESFGDRSFSYFQDARHRNLIYHLPDRFALMRHSGDFRPPQMTLTVTQPGESTDSAQSALDYVIAPWTDPARIDHARGALSRRLGLKADEIDFQRLLPASATYVVRRPTARGLVHDERIVTSQIVQEPFPDRLLMPLEDFQVAFTMMRGSGAGQLGGTVTAQIEGWDAESIAVDFDLSALSEDALRIRVFVGGDELLVKLTNVIESPVVLDGAKLALEQGAVRAELALPGTETAMQIAPGEEAEFTCPRPPGIDNAPMEVRPVAGISAQTDHEALLNAILDTTTLEYFRTIEFEAIPSVFRVPDEDPGRQVIMMVVSFDNGESVVLRPGELRAQVRIDYPLLPVLLQQQVDGSFTYRRRIVRENGEQQELEPKSAFDTLIIISGTN